jgi:hypothetical protein
MGNYKIYKDGGMARSALCQSIHGFELPTSDIDLAIVGDITKSECYGLGLQDDWMCYWTVEDFFSTVNFTFNEVLLDDDGNVISTERAKADMASKVIRFTGLQKTAKQYGQAVRYYIKYAQYGFVLAPDIESYVSQYWSSLSKSRRFTHQAFKKLNTPWMGDWADVVQYVQGGG